MDSSFLVCIWVIGWISSSCFDLSLLCPLSVVYFVCKGIRWICHSFQVVRCKNFNFNFVPIWIPPCSELENEYSSLLINQPKWSHQFSRHYECGRIITSSHTSTLLTHLWSLFFGRSGKEISANGYDDIHILIANTQFPVYIIWLSVLESNDYFYVIIHEFIIVFRLIYIGHSNSEWEIVFYPSGKSKAVYGNGILLYNSVPVDWLDHFILHEPNRNVPCRIVEEMGCDSIVLLIWMPGCYIHIYDSARLFAFALSFVYDYVTYLFRWFGEHRQMWKNDMPLKK